MRALHEAPGHEFLEHERAELTSFLDLTVAFRWGGVLLGVESPTCAKISHDFWVRFRSETEIDSIAEIARGWKLPFDRA